MLAVNLVPGIQFNYFASYGTGQRHITFQVELIVVGCFLYGNEKSLSILISQYASSIYIDQSKCTTIILSTEREKTSLLNSFLYYITTICLFYKRVKHQYHKTNLMN